MGEQEPQESPRLRHPVTMRECDGLIRVEIRGVEMRNEEDGSALQGAFVRFLMLPANAAVFGVGISGRCREEWSECAATAGMERDAFLAYTRALRPGEERRFAVSGA